ncbi:NrdR family transcriptional regulator [Bacillus litorisediminis]|uniref:NrdR family transcriptional regulator n=1 Tax=Bacillus litorisediminis TaxID=2922713 RepID=UPI0036F26A25
MKCPICKSENVRVLDKRNRTKGIYRRRECEDCLTRFSTHEFVVTKSLDKHLLEMMERRK